MSKKLKDASPDEIREIVRKLTPKFNQLLLDIEIVNKLIEENYPRLAKAGWTIPLEFTLTETYELLSGNTQEHLDQYFLHYYTQNEYYFLDELFASLLANSYLIKWNKLLSECINAYKDGYCLITIPSLISAIEGVLSVHWPNKDNTNVKIISKAMIAKYDEDTLEKTAWLSIHEFVCCLFKGAAFSKKRPPIINRHWILHGRDETQWQQIDAIRLFHALHTISVTYFKGQNELRQI